MASRLDALERPVEQALERGTKTLQTIFRKLRPKQLGALQTTSNEATFLIEVARLAIESEVEDGVENDFHQARLHALARVAELRKMAGEPTVEIHPRDAEHRGLRSGQWVRVFNDRGAFRARAVVGETVKEGAVVTQGVWWTKYTPDGVNCNATTGTRLTDFGAGATFFDNLVEVAADAR